MMLNHARDTELGDYYQILGGLKEFQEALKGVDYVESKLGAVWNMLCGNGWNPMQEGN